MRHQFYSDQRDLLKWGTLLHLAQQHKINLILQLAYLRPDNRSFTLTVTRSGTPTTIDLPPEVWSHFRNIRKIKGLGETSGLSIEIFDEAFEKPYEEYTHKAVAWIQRYSKRKIVFLDPDTGIAPPLSRRELKHVSGEEIAEIFAAMRPRDILVLYQHGRRTQNWVKEPRRQFAEALSLPADTNRITTIASPAVRDVAFFAITKSP